MSAEGLTSGMQERWAEAAELFATKIVSGSDLAKGDTNQVVLYGVSQGSLGMTDYGSTTLYIGKDGYQGEDYEKFVEVWGFRMRPDCRGNWLGGLC